MPLAIGAVASHAVDVPLALALVVLYAISSRMLKFPIGAGYVVPSYLVLVPMLLLLPPGLVPLLTAAGLVLGTLAQVVLGRARPAQRDVRDPRRLARRSVRRSCSWPREAGGQRRACALAVHRRVRAPAACSTSSRRRVREWAIAGIASRLQLRVIAQSCG